MYELFGKVKHKTGVVQVSEKIKRAEIVVITNDDYPQHVPFEVVNDRCKLLDNLNVGDNVKVGFTLRGREYTPEGKDTKHILNLEAKTIQKAKVVFE